MGTVSATKVGMMELTVTGATHGGHIFVMTEPHSESVRKQQRDNNKDDRMPTQNPHRIVGLCTSSKVYGALTELKHLEGHRCAKFLSLLAENLVHKGLLNEREVLHMLDQVVD
ncbi:Uncharacterised protein [Pseudomonas fluorescens]|uniref:Uncharacterized protein n=2 Tax=Pseudomonas fluorescens TaxID=294 RepID=A0A3S4PVS2_PSEFL|nr:Uncharacterised protein [Pseudomonas fluorescens]